ncbi:MAG: helix-turn-helix domain-containing protein [Fidelibacterota bacterium]|nr:MAG: helix-turn-helix domain-containing protein [Candidatus Neomarinimicrobiota bacterium]
MEDNDGFNLMIEMINRQRLYRTGEVAALMGCSVRYVQLLVELGHLEALRMGRIIRIPGLSLVRFIEKHKEWDG